jgi:hypothetical protein
VTRLLPFLLLAACTTIAPGTFGEQPIALDDDLRLEIVRYAGRMTATAWIDDKANLLFRTRLNRPTFELPVEFSKAESHYRALERKGGPRAETDRRFADDRALIDDEYAFDVRTEFEKFWKTGPFGTPADADRSFALAERVHGPGVHALHIAVEPDTVSWSATFRIVRGDRVLYTYDFDSERRVVLDDAAVVAPPILLQR